MKVLTTELLKARDAEDAYALRIVGETQTRASTGFGSDFEPIWSVEFQGNREVELLKLDWDGMLERALEAHSLSDPVISNFEWPERAGPTTAPK